MEKKAMLKTGLKYLGVGMLLWGLITPWAVAGPEQDTELAEMEFARGDVFAALNLWTKAAQQGYAPAQVRLGDILDKAEEDVDAAAWYRKAADQGNAAGEYGLGQMYLKGEGVKKDVEQARTYILRAAEKGNLAAVTMMLYAYRNGALGFAVDNTQANAWEDKLVALSPGYKREPVIDKEKTKKTDKK